MEDQVINLFKAIKEKFPLIQFEIVHNSFSPTLKHFVLKENKHIKGFGGAHDELLAANKAFSEFIERKALAELNKSYACFETSNGFAAHVDFDSAQASSRNEVIERDAFLVSWHSKTAPYWLSSDDTAKLLSDENSIILKAHFKHKLNLRIGLVAISESIITAIACVECSDTKYSFYVDCKTGENLVTLANALVESVAYNSHFIIKGYREKTNFNDNQLTSPMDHFNYYMQMKKNTEWFFKGSESVLEFPPEEIATFDCDIEALLGIKNLNRVVCFSESEAMQTYYCGKVSKENYNKQRFESIFGENFKPNKQVHPLS